MKLLKRWVKKNAVQVVTDNTANYTAAGTMLMAKRTGLYQTPCAKHCIDLLLEDFENKILIHQKTIPKPEKNYNYEMYYP